MEASKAATWHDPPAPAPRAPYKANGVARIVAVVVVAIATGLGSSYVTVITATPSRPEVREMISQATNALRETQGLDRASMLEWRAMQTESFSDIRQQLRKLADEQAGTNKLLEMLMRKQEQRP